MLETLFRQTRRIAFVCLFCVPALKASAVDEDSTLFGLHAMSGPMQTFGLGQKVHGNMGAFDVHFDFAFPHRFFSQLFMGLGFGFGQSKANRESGQGNYSKFYMKQNLNFGNFRLGFVQYYADWFGFALVGAPGIFRTDLRLDLEGDTGIQSETQDTRGLYFEDSLHLFFRLKNEHILDLSFRAWHMLSYSPYINDAIPHGTLQSEVFLIGLGYIREF